jgi:cobalt/nickel transport system permease protein
MHIPEGYLGPQTYGAAYAVMVPFWIIAGRKLRRTLSARRVPLLAVGAALSFVVMMFNVPIPGGSPGHATGAPLIAILLGPWAAVLAVSVVLAVQAVLFGDGGITALGANCFNMAVAMPFVSYWVYRAVSVGARAQSPRRIVAAALGAYLGLNVAAVTTAFMFGIQPAIASGPDGRALYCPFGLGLAVPVMAAEHLLIFGFVEAAVTALAIAYLARTEPDLVAPARAPAKRGVA